jgi:hypothetical protein
VLFFTAEGVGGREIHRRMSVVYGEQSMSRSCVLALYKRFWEGHVSMQDDARPRQAHCVITPDVTAVLDGPIRANRQITSLFFSTCLHYWCWTTTHSSTINKELVCKGTSLCFPKSPVDVHAVSKSQCYQVARRESCAWWPVFIWLPFIHLFLF